MHARRVRPLFCNAHLEMLSSSRRPLFWAISADAVVIPPPVFHPRLSRTRQPGRLVWEFARRRSRQRPVIPTHCLMLCAESDSPVKRSGGEKRARSGSGSLGEGREEIPVMSVWRSLDWMSSCCCCFEGVENGRLVLSVY